jgi:CRISPR-associated endonuclease/helicase Cas3
LSVPEDIAIERSYDKSTTLFNALKDADLRVRLVQPTKMDDEGDAVQSLLVLAPAPAKKAKEDQRLTEHIDGVESEATRIANALHLADEDPIRVALLFAAKWHDEGKKARIWQVFANNPDPNGPALGKMAQARDPKSLRGYRHEFGSLLRIRHPERCGTTVCDLSADTDVRELGLHLIATHHGAGRPHFADAIYDPFTDAERDAVRGETIRRFARLQRKYGWWHLAWLENLLRCADQLASANEEVTEIDEMGGGEQ